MRSQDIIQEKNHVRKVTDILIIIKKTTRIIRLSQQQFTKKIYTTFY